MESYKVQLVAKRYSEKACIKHVETFSYGEE
jgi:hypothetical protein